MISIVIPTYNEAGYIENSINSINSTIKNLSKEYEILVVDDMSPDGTGNIVREISKTNKHVHLIEKEKKEGMGAAYLFGYSKAKGDIIIAIDADLSQDPKHFVDFLRELNNDFDIVIGSRYIKGGRMYGKTFTKLIGSKIANLISYLVLGLKVKDATHTFRAFKRKVYEELKDNLKEKGHPSFEIEFTYKAYKKNFKIKEIPVIFRETKNPEESKVNTRKEFFKFMKCIINLRRESK